MLRLWVDTVEPPDVDWDWVTTSEAAIAMMEEFRGEGMTSIKRDVLACSYKLHGDDTVAPVLRWMVENNFKFDHYYINSAPQDKRAWVEDVITRYLT